MSDTQLTCLVPTHNRPQFLRRLMRFYAQFQPDFSFLVVDSSNSSLATENQSVVEGVSRQLNIRYQHLDRPFYEKISIGLASVHSPFVVLCADDDYVIPEAVSRCAEFLASEPAYESAMGHKALLNTMKRGWPGKLKILKGYSFESDSTLDRCRQMVMNWVSNFYAVYRTQTLLDNFRIVAANSSPKSLPQLPEMLMSQLSVIRGRAKVLPMMYSVWQRHETNWSNTVAKSLQPQAELHYSQFKACLSDQLHQTGIDRAESESHCDDWYGHFRSPSFTSQRRRISTTEWINRAFRGIPERIADFIWTDRVRHCRSVRACDLVGCESTWQTAVKLICDFPQGIPAEPVSLNRCA